MAVITKYNTHIRLREDLIQLMVIHHCLTLVCIISDPIISDKLCERLITLAEGIQTLS